MWAVIAIVYHVSSRLLYVLGVGSALRLQQRRRVFTRDRGVEQGFRRFRRMASVILNNDGLSFVVLCVITRGTLTAPFASVGAIALGGLLCVAGIGTKVWAARTLGSKAYYWHNFFADDDPVFPAKPGPYRFIDNPMYTVGYLHTYGLALITGSLPGLFAAGFDQVTILLFNRWIERPHFELILANALDEPGVMP